jgi:hypothetical protein
VVSLCSAHSSTALTVSAGMRDDTIGSRPVAGRPRFFFWSTFIDFFMIFGLHKKQAEGKGASFRPGSNPDHKETISNGQGYLRA